MLASFPAPGLAQHRFLQLPIRTGQRDSSEASAGAGMTVGSDPGDGARGATDQVKSKPSRGHPGPQEWATPSVEASPSLGCQVQIDAHCPLVGLCPGLQPCSVQ